MRLSKNGLRHHLIGGFKAGVGDFCDSELLVVSLLGRNDRRVSGQREVDPRVRDQVSLELGQIHVQGSIETQGSCEVRQIDDSNEDTMQEISDLFIVRT